MKNKILLKNTNKFKILTPSGFQDFSGVSNVGFKEIYRIKLENGSYLECTYDHKIKVSKTKFKELSLLKVGDFVLTTNGKIKIQNIIDLERKEIVYDIIEVANGNEFYSNDIISHNCEFITDSDTLIDSIKLATLKGVNPEFTTAQTKWYSKPEANKTYLVSLDPCMGNGNDYAAIEVFQLPEMLQVAEWQHNKTPVPGQVKTLMEILKYIDQTLREDYDQYSEPEIYWSVENNGIGEAVNVVIQHTGEEKFPGTYLNEPKKSKGAQRTRRGYCTSNKSKLEACSRFKSLLERDKMTIKSKPLISELKNFVSKGASYGAKSKEHDDLVCSTLLIVRMLEKVLKYNEEYEEQLSESIEDDTSSPLPILVTRY